jgi:hypothetical protein
MTTPTGDIWEWYREEVQILMRDFAGNNILLDGVHFSPKEIERAICRTISEYRTLPPQAISGTITSLPSYLVILGAARWLSLSETFLQIRNQVSFQTDDNEAVGIDDKAPFYLQLHQTLKAEFKQAAREHKMSKNMEEAYGNLESGYLNVTRFNS